jgi:hypothetical protein
LNPVCPDKPIVVVLLSKIISDLHEISKWEGSWKNAGTNEVPIENTPWYD